MSNRAVAPIVLAGALALGAASCSGPPASRFQKPIPAPPTPIVLANVRVIDGTGEPAREAQTLVLRDGKIVSVGPGARAAVPPGAHVIDLAGRTVFPGLVGVHNHLFYHVGSGNTVAFAQESFSRLYLATGVTTIRTAGTLDFEGERRLKAAIDAGSAAGPSIHLTSPYLHASGATPDPARVTNEVNRWADRGATSFKAYTSLRRDELKAAIDAAHARGLKVTGHLCAVGFQEAAGLGIDNLEHGLLADSEFFSGKQPDACPDSSPLLGELMYLDISSPVVARMISALVRRGVTITSTLAVYETLNSRAKLDDRTLTVLASSAQDAYRAARARHTEQAQGDSAWRALLRKEMEFERAFVAAGGRLAAGNDPTAWGGIVAGFGDQRQLELLVDAGFTPEAAIRIATLNGAVLLNDLEAGRIAEGLRADLVVVRGNPAANISDVRNVETVFKKGIAYDPDALIAGTAGTVGGFDLRPYLISPFFPVVVVLFVLVVVRRLLRWRKKAAAARG
jgi:imidazolonepropionase-like amidohydrolase